MIGSNIRIRGKENNELQRNIPLSFHFKKAKRKGTRSSGKLVGGKKRQQEKVIGGKQGARKSRIRAGKNKNH